MIRPHDHQRAPLRVDAVCLVRVAVSRVVALVIDKNIKETWGSLRERGLGVTRIRIAHSHLIFHFPVTGVKTGGIRSSSILVRRPVRTRTEWKTLSGSAPAGVKSATIFWRPSEHYMGLACSFLPASLVCGGW